MTPPVDLNGRRILLGITGSIAAYKACEIARLFVKAGAEVRVVMTPAAERFVSPLTFEALTRQPVLTESGESWSDDRNHIDTAKWAEAFVIAPATANTLNKLSKGIADNLLLQTALAYAGPLLVAPAANTQMLRNHYTEGSLKMLKVNDVTVVEPVEKLLACGDEGSGALAEPLEIFYQTARALLIDEFWKDRKAVVTGGGTREAIDAVRFIGNRSSGKMADALATALWLRGADICYLRTVANPGLPAQIYTIEVESAEEMGEYLIDCIRVAKKGVMSRPSMNNPNPVGMIQKTPYLFMAAAVSDYRSRYPQEGKLKKSALGEHWTLELIRNPDLLSSLDKTGIVTVAFKAETDPEKGPQNARQLLDTKGVDAVCYNHVGEGKGFGSEENAVTFITPDREAELATAPKTELAYAILDEAKKLADE
ncbi:bifunctional phosphopantothenoylcysteine decarboxylase/phosphopantothenate--cysteine ligase CoaBC [Nitratifractor sp.]